jgi:hypothetical protein
VEAWANNEIALAQPNTTQPTTCESSRIDEHTRTFENPGSTPQTDHKMQFALKLYTSVLLAGLNSPTRSLIRLAKVALGKAFVDPAPTKQWRMVGEKQ